MDNDVETFISFMDGIDRGADIQFSFAESIPVYSISIYLNEAVEDLDISGDGDGDGVFETILGSARQLKGKGWVTIYLKPDLVKALRVKPVKGKLSGFREALPFASEVKIFVEEDYASKASPPGWGSFTDPGQPPADIPKLVLKPVRMSIPQIKKSRFRRLICADLWMWGIQVKNDPNIKAEGLTDNPTYKRTLEMVKRMGVEGILIDLTDSSSQNLMPWPSKVCRGTKENFLKVLTDSLHQDGLEVFVELLHNITPFETTKFHYPQEETSRYPEMKQYPSIIHGNHYRENWMIILKEIMECGADGVGVSFDEQYYKGHFMETFPKDDPGRLLYRERFGYDLPEHEEDS
ncbi:MAG: hypothetical protein AB1659_13925, partial [Thermodesulfobacteriota bacterium]